MSDLPDGWRMVKLGEVASIVMGQSPPSAEYNREGLGFPFLQGKAEFTDFHPLPTTFCTRPLKVGVAGSVLMSVRAPVGDVNVADQDYVIGRGLASIRLRQGDDEFCFYALLRSESRISALGTGTTFQSINRAALEGVEFPMPTAREQRAIAQALRAVQDARDARRRELAVERERKSALTTHLFTYGVDGGDHATRESDFGEAPARWRTMLLSECAYVQTGAAKGRRFNDGIEVPYLRVANVQDGYLDLSEIKTISIRRGELDRYRLRPGDVVLTEGGDFDKLGRGFVWRGEVPDCVHQNHVFAVRVNRACLTPKFFAYLAGSRYGKAYFLSVAHKTTNLACINTTKLKAFPVLVPPLGDQEIIVATLTACDQKIAALETEAALHDELFRAMLDDLLTGRLSALPLADKCGGNDEPTA